MSNVKKLFLLILGLPLVQIAVAEGPAADTAGISLGAFILSSDTGVRLGNSTGLDVDLEDALDFDSNTSVFRTEAYWRFTENHKHRIDVSWFALRRSGRTQIGDDIEIEDRDGNTVTIPTGTEVDSHLDFDLYEVAYSYSFLQDQRVDFAAIGGLYFMPIDFGLNASGLVDASGGFEFTAPLPVIGLRLDVALWPKWYFRSSTQLFSFESSGFDGYLRQLRGAVEYAPIDRLAVGLGFDSMNMSMDGMGAHFPGIDLRGKIDYQYSGVQLYGKVFF